VIDREGAAIEPFHGIIASGDGFVIRLTKQRRVELEGVSLKVLDAANQFEGIHELEVPLSRRRPHFFKSKEHAPRRARTARLEYAAAPVSIRRPWMADPGSLPPTIAVNLVCAKEVDPPEGEEPVDWILATNLPISTVHEVIRVVDTYKARWRIEEFFKALKTGCAFEKRQLETLDATKKLLAISLVVAWRILLLRDESRCSPERPTTSLSRTEIAVLRETGPLPLSKKPTAREALLAVAALGGHIKNNGDPGWLVIGRGFERLVERTHALFALSRLSRGRVEKLMAIALREM